MPRKTRRRYMAACFREKRERSRRNPWDGGSWQLIATKRIIMKRRRNM